MKKTTRLFWLVALPLVLGLSACTDKDSVAEGAVETVETPEVTLPTDDQMAVTVTEDVPTAVLGTFDEGTTGAALVNRLPVVTDHIGPETRLVLVPGSMFDGNGMSADDIDALVRLSLDGGYLAIERPTAQQLLNFAVLYVAKLIELQQLQYEETFDLDSGTAAAAAARSQMLERFQTRQANIQQMATTRSGDDDLNKVQAEMVIYGPTDYFMQQAFDDEQTAYVHTEDSEGNTTNAEAVTAKTERTAYISGTLADAAAEWLNAKVTDNDDEQEQSAPRRAMHRAGGSAINDIMDASEEFTYNEAIDWRNADNETYHYTNRVNMIVRSWGVHNMDTNKDFYYLKQNVTLKMGENKGYKIFWQTQGDSWWYYASNYGYYDRWYGSFLSQYVTSMNLTGNGSIRLEAAKPDTDNNTSSTSVSVGSSSSKTETLGMTWGLTGSASPGVNFGGNYSQGTTTGSSFTLGMSQTSKDFRGAKNTSGTQVTWTYKGTLPKYYEDPGDDDWIYYKHQTPADILVNDCDVANEICWSVANPSGRYTFNITSQPQTAALLFYKSGKTRPNKYEYTTTTASNHTQELLQPNRAMQTWRMSITVDEWEGAEVAGAREYLQNEVRKQFPDIYADVFQVADKSAESLDVISYVINYSKKVFGNTANMEALKSLAKSKGVKKFSIHWRSDRGVQASTPFDFGNIPYVLWCEGNSTLYFVSSPNNLNVGNKWDGQTITWLCSGTSVKESPSLPAWIKLKKEWTNDYAHETFTRVVIDKSFADIRPKSLSQWFFNFYHMTTFEGLEYLNTSEVTTMAYMFDGCINLTTLNVNEFDMSKVTNTKRMFRDCQRLTTIYCNQTWNVSNSNNMFEGCMELEGADRFSFTKPDDCSMANPTTGYFTKIAHETSLDLYIKDAQANTDQLKKYESQWVNIRYSRSLQAKVGSNGDYEPTPYTVCLPYDLDLSAAVNSGQAVIYTLAAVTDGQFVFKKVKTTTLAAGTPYVVMVNRGKIALSAKGVKIAVVEPSSSKVYASVADWQKGSGTTVGDWMGTFDQWDSDEAVAWDAFALKPSNNMWDYYSATGTGSIPAFRAFLSSSSIEQKEYKARYED